MLRQLPVLPLPAVHNYFLCCCFSSFLSCVFTFTKKQPFQSKQLRPPTATHIRGTKHQKVKKYIIQKPVLFQGFHFDTLTALIDLVKPGRWRFSFESTRTIHFYALTVEHMHCELAVQHCELVDLPFFEKSWRMCASLLKIYFSNICNFGWVRDMVMFKNHWIYRRRELEDIHKIRSKYSKMAVLQARSTCCELVALLFYNS